MSLSYVEWRQTNSSTMSVVCVALRESFIIVQKTIMTKASWLMSLARARVPLAHVRRDGVVLLFCLCFYRACGVTFPLRAVKRLSVLQTARKSLRNISNSTQSSLYQFLLIEDFWLYKSEWSNFCKIYGFIFEVSTYKFCKTILFKGWNAICDRFNSYMRKRYLFLCSLHLINNKCFHVILFMIALKSKNEIRVHRPLFTRKDDWAI